MKKLIVIACVALGAGVAVSTAVAQDGGEGCFVSATYATAPGPVTSEDEIPAWMTTTSGRSASSGIMTTDVPHWPNITLYGNLPNAVRMTTLRGAWTRTGGNTSAFTQIGWALDANGDAVYVIRQSGRGTTTEGCNKLTIEATIEFFWPPSTFPDGAPIWTEWEDPMDAYRVAITPPVPPPVP